MKRILALLIVLFLFLVSCKASSIPLAWDAGSPGCSYSLYASTNAITQANYSASVVRVNVGTNLTATVDIAAPGKWWFCATAVKDDVESAISNVIQVEVPKEPAQMRVIALQYSHTLTNGWTDTGFFRIRIQ